MSSLQERVEVLEQDLVADPPRISAYHDLPFAIFQYDPQDEFECRNRARLLAISLQQNHQRRVTYVSLAEIMWKAIRETEGIAAIAEIERQYGFERAQQTVSTLLSDPDFMPLAAELTRRVQSLDPRKDIVFLVRAAALAPAIYRCAKLLDEMHGRTMVPIILFYPGTIQGNTALRFMDMENREDIGTYNYRVKIY